MAKSSPEGIELGKGSTLIKMEVSVGEEQYTLGLEMGQIPSKEGGKINPLLMDEVGQFNFLPKQETLKEYDAESYLAGVKSDLAKDYWYKQQERMYSEMDIVLILSKFRDMKMIAFSEWFEKFKK